METSKENYQYEIQKANLTIANLQQEISRVHGENAILKAENQMMASYIKDQEKDKENKPAQEKSKKKGE